MEMWRDRLAVMPLSRVNGTSVEFNNCAVACSDEKRWAALGVKIFRAGCTLIKATARDAEIRMPTAFRFC